MAKTSIERKRQRKFGAIVVAGSAVGGVVAACSGGGEFTKGAPTKDPDASVESGAGGEPPGSGGGGNTGSGASAPVTGGSANGGAGGKAPVDAGRDGSDGGLPPPQCVRDEDCAPFICDGTATCTEGVCAPGRCESHDGGACVNECVRTATAASCVAMGRDEDHDGHRDARCQENPGDDCDDTKPTVHSAAKEICDGLDNDCDGLVDSFDGLPFGGVTTHVKDVAKTAQLSLVTTPSGFALLSNEMPDAFGGVANPSEIRILAPNGAEQRIVDVLPAVRMLEPAMAASGDTLLVVGVSPPTFPSQYNTVARLKTDGTWQPTIGVAPVDELTGTYGRAIATVPDGSAVVVYAMYTNSTNGGVEGFRVDTFDQTNLSDQVTPLGSTPWRAYRPHIARRGEEDYHAIWANIQPISGSTTEVKAEVRLARVKIDGRPYATFSLGYLLDAFNAPLADIHLRGEAVRPQVSTVDQEHLVAAFRKSQGKLGFVRMNDLSGAKVCQVATIDGIASWGSSTSLAHTPLGTLLAATSTDGDVVLYRLGHGTVELDKPCPFERIGILNAPGSRVAISALFEQRTQPVSMGDPAIASDGNGRLAIAWVERDETAAEVGAGGVVNDPRPPRVVLQVVGDKLCN